MAENEKYYYLKLKYGFTRSSKVLLLLSMDHGYEMFYTLISFYLESLEYNGRLIISESVPYTTKSLAKVSGFSENKLKKFLEIFEKLDLIKILPNGVIYMLDIQNFIGKSSTEGDRKRNYRNEIDAEVERQMSQTTNGQMGIHTEIKKDINDRDKINNSLSGTTVRIVSHLNKAAGTKFKPTIQKTRDLISARLNDGFTEADFITVIDKKVEEWTGTDMQKYLRPQTLFGTKFEAYLNQDICNNNNSAKASSKYGNLDSIK